MNDQLPMSFQSIVGQPALHHLASYAQAAAAGRLESKCWLLVGAPGVGKTSSALALAAALGCRDELSGLSHLHGASLSVARARLVFEGTLPRRSRSQSDRSCVILDDLHWLTPECAQYVSGALDSLAYHSRNVSVVATAHETTGIDCWLLDRFRLLAFSDGEWFEKACQDHLRTLWRESAGSELPPGWTFWGKGFNSQTFSMRKAMQSFAEAMAARPDGVA